MNDLVSQRRAHPLGYLAIALGTALILAVGYFVWRRAASGVNEVALASRPKPVALVPVKASTFRSSRAYVGTVHPWLEARLGPQLVSAYVDTVLVRPGAKVSAGDVLATLDCRNTSAASQAVAMQARALDARQRALAHETARMNVMLDGGFVSANEVEQRTAQTASEEAQLLSVKAKLLGSSLELSDCVIRAPFTGEVATRAVDPGAFVRPGMTVVTVVDRSQVRIGGDAPEVDFSIVAPESPVTLKLLATGRDVSAKVGRRAPVADAATRTVHFEIDVVDPERQIPIGTTAELRFEVGAPQPAAEIPIYAATVRGSKAQVFVVESGKASSKTFNVLGEIAGRLYLSPELKVGTSVVGEGRALLNDGDLVGTESVPR